MKEIRCTHCGSENVQKASVIYEGGTSTGTSISGGSFGGRPGGFATSTRSQTKLASKLQPPPNMGIFAMIGCVVGILITGYITISLLPHHEPWWLFWLFLAGLQTFALLRGLSRNKVYPEKMESYNKMWYCQKCGEISQL